MGKIKKGRKGAKGDASDSEGDQQLDTQQEIEKGDLKKAKTASNKKAVEVDNLEQHAVEKKKGKQQSKKNIQSDNESDSGEAQPPPEKSKGKKSGKDKKKITPDDSDEEIIEKKSAPVATNKKGAKKANKKKGGNDSDEEEDAPVVSKVAKSFALLQVDSGESENDNMSAENDSDEDDDEVKPVKKNTSSSNKKKGSSDTNKLESDNRTKESGGGKKSKKSKRKKDDSDEDIDKVLAELEMEYSGGKQEEPAIVKVEEHEEEVVEKKSKSKKKGNKGGTEKTEEVKSEEGGDATAKDESEETSTIKTAAQKKKEKKERDKIKKKQDTQQSNQAKPKEETPDKEEAPVEKQPQPTSTEPSEDVEKETKGKKKKGAASKAEDAKKGIGKKTIAAMQEALKKMREEEERVKKEAEEQLKRDEEAEEARLEAVRLEKERKEKKKQKEKERKERLKAEGKFLTAKQKANLARAQAMIDNLKAQGMELPDAGERKVRPGTRIKPSKQNKQKLEQEKSSEVAVAEETPKIEEEQKAKDEEQPVEKNSDDDVKDAWDAETSEEEESEEVNSTSENKQQLDGKADQDEAQDAAEEDESSTTEEKSDSEEEELEEEEDNDHRTDAEKRREKALARIEQRKLNAEKNKSLDVLRAPVVCVLGHVDTGKTKILDKLRRTNVQDAEAGGITQQIGATNVPIEAIKDNIKHTKSFSSIDFKLPGLLIIDTPGHESFSNLRSRGSSLCDIAILVVDIMHGLEPQTLESINLLKAKKTPFIVALNKIDRLYDWVTMNRRDIVDIVKNQAANTQLEFEKRTQEVILQFAEQGLNAALCYDNPDERSYVSLVPTSAITGEGMGNLLSLIVENCQNRLAKRLMYSEDLQATVLEVKAISGLGTTIDIILVNGTLKEGDTMVLAGTDGPITTQIRSLLTPHPLKELRVKNNYLEFKTIQAAQGVKIAAKDLDKAIAGLNLYVAQQPDEVDILREIVAKELKKALSSIKLQERGVYVQASTLGSLEALLEFLRQSKIPYSGIRIGPVVKKDVMKASIMLEHDNQYATILAFDVKVERDAQELADNLGVKIFLADIIYHLFDNFTKYCQDLKAKKKEEFKNIAVFPCKLRILPQYVFNSRDPIVMGVMVEGGIVKEGTPLCVPTKEFLEIGIVTGIEINHKNVDKAGKGQEVCVKIEPVPGESPKMFGRHFDETDFLVSKISRQSIDACKDHFRDDLTKQDWQLMVELKKQFQIL